MTKDLLALHREPAVPIHPEPAQLVPAGTDAPDGKVMDAGAFVFKAGPLPAASTEATTTREQAR
jgi:hypothetical protein